MKALVDVERVIEIDKSDFCTECSRYVGKWLDKCNECNKEPITFADGLEEKK